MRYLAEVKLCDSVGGGAVADHTEEGFIFVANAGLFAGATWDES